MKIQWIELISRILLALIIGGAVGYEREFKNRPAGTKTHILVCMGACIIALIQQEIALRSLQTAIHYPELKGVVRSDEARLIAQVVSGVGFLGAGTIIVQKRAIVGLTTAASIWAVAGLGIASGMGYYHIAFIGLVSILFALLVTNRLLEIMPTSKKIEIKYTHKERTQAFLHRYFEQNGIKVVDVNFTKEQTKNDGKERYTNIYSVDLPRKLNYTSVIEDLSGVPDIVKIRTIRL